MATKFSALTATALRTIERNRGRVFRGVKFIVTCEADDGSWFELDAESVHHAQVLAVDQVQKMNCRGCSCWVVKPTGKLARKPFAHRYWSHEE